MARDEEADTPRSREPSTSASYIAPRRRPTRESGDVVDDEVAGRHEVQVTGEPVFCERGDLFEGARFLEEVRCARHDLEARLAAELRERLAVEFHDDVVAPTHDQEHRLVHL